MSVSQSADLPVEVVFHVAALDHPHNHVDLTV